MVTIDDVTLVFEGVNLECSKKELALHSDYFKAMFEGNFMERDKDVIELKGVNFRALRICLIMLWDRKFVLTDEDMPLVLQTACMLQFDEITEIVSDKLWDSLDASNCLKVWFLTEPLNLKPLYVKAKNLALVEFETVRNNGSMLNLNLEEVHQYLANVYLSCKEFDVFTAFMNWYYENGNNMMELLACLDFNRLTNKEIGEMMMYKEVRSSLTLVNILECVVEIRNGGKVRNDLADKLLNCNRRICLNEPYFFVATETEGKEIASKGYRDYKRRTSKILTMNCVMSLVDNAESSFFRKAMDLCKDKISEYSGYELIGHKQNIFFFGGETSLGSGHWNSAFWMYDTVKERWQSKQSMPSGRRHFETCIIDNIVYVVGGIGKYRVIQENMLVFDYVKNTWSEEIKLPETGPNVKCCNYLNRLFLFHQSTKCGYLYSHEKGSFVQLSIVDKNFPTIEGKFGVYCYDDRIFIMDSTRLVELRVVLNKLRVVKVTRLPSATMEVGDKYILCEDTVYNLYKHDSTCVSISTFNLQTLETKCLYRHLSNYAIENSKYVFNGDSKMLALQHHIRLPDKDKYVNTSKNIYAK